MLTVSVGARLALVKAYSPVLPSLNIVTQCAQWDYAHESAAWFDRVPTRANVAHGPSRLSADQVVQELGGQVQTPVFPEGLSPAL